ncbi:hypothetical protein SSX86_016291 [Deinandra increscens subsp. villosa]|uniref:Uncharacterized protein n=1 Tax=Deinandra increscens subsp. villosa TaxID=3103831 RepID=A0AAP0D1Y2_9ASTR
MEQQPVDLHSMFHLNVQAPTDSVYLKDDFARLHMKMDTPERVLGQAHGQARSIVDLPQENSATAAEKLSPMLYSSQHQLPESPRLQKGLGVIASSLTYIGNAIEIPNGAAGHYLLGLIYSRNVANQPNNGVHPNTPHYNTPSPMTTQISGRLFSDSGPRRSTRVAGEGVSMANINGITVAGNGTNHSSKYPSISKLGSAAFRSVTVRKGQSLSTETFSEGVRSELDDTCSNTATTTSGSSLPPDTRSCEHDSSVNRASMSVSKLASGALQVLSLLKIIGEGYRLSCLYRCQDALDVFMQLPHKHYNTGWVLSQVGKAHFELVDYLEAERAFNNARLASPYSLEGMDIYSTVLYHLKEDMKLSYLAQELISTDHLAPQSWCACLE